MKRILRCGLFWRFLLSNLLLSALAVGILTAAFNLAVTRQLESKRRQDTAYLADLAKAMNLPPLPEGPLQAYMIRTDVGRAVLLSTAALESVRNDKALLEIRTVGSGQTAPPPQSLAQALTDALRTLTPDEIARVTTMAQSVTFCPEDVAGIHCAVVASLEARPPVDHLVVTLLPPGRLDELRRSAWHWVLPIAALLLVGSAIIAWVQSLTLVQPLREFNRVAALVAEGDLSQRVPGRGPGELGQAISRFNRLVDHLSADRALQTEKEQGRRDLVASISHEFRAPLASLRGYLELLQDGVIRPQDQPKYLSVMLADTLRLSRLMEDLLDLARIQAEQITLRPLETDPIDACQRVAEQLLWQANQNQVKLALDLPDTAPAVYADPDRLDQVLVNLLENALRYAGQGGWVRLAVTAGPQVRFEVHDSGPGIPPEEHDRIWERFYKADKARTPGESGSGLGLAIVRELVEAMGGQVGLQSQVGRGSTFWFTLPLAQPPA
ncbi:MAG: sensor histidine kinase [Bacillota bacterium]